MFLMISQSTTLYCYYIIIVIVHIDVSSSIIRVFIIESIVHAVQSAACVERICMIKNAIRRIISIVILLPYMSRQWSVIKTNITVRVKFVLG